MKIPSLSEVFRVWSDPSVLALFLSVATVTVGMYVTARAAREADEREYRYTRERLGSDFSLIMLLTTSTLAFLPDARVLTAVMTLVGIYFAVSTAYRVTNLRQYGMPARYVRYVVAGGALQLAGTSTFVATCAGWIG